MNHVAIIHDRLNPFGLHWRYYHAERDEVLQFARFDAAFRHCVTEGKIPIGKNGERLEVKS